MASYITPFVYNVIVSAAFFSSTFFNCNAHLQTQPTVRANLVSHLMSPNSLSIPIMISGQTLLASTSRSALGETKLLTLDFYCL
jgi:hypothetical protein